MNKAIIVFCIIFIFANIVTADWVYCYGLGNPPRVQSKTTECCNRVWNQNSFKAWFKQMCDRGSRDVNQFSNCCAEGGWSVQHQ